MFIYFVFFAKPIVVTLLKASVNRNSFKKKIVTHEHNLKSVPMVFCNSPGKLETVPQNSPQMAKWQSLLKSWRVVTYFIDVTENVCEKLKHFTFEEDSFIKYWWVCLLYVITLDTAVVSCSYFFVQIYIRFIKQVFFWSIRSINVQIIFAAKSYMQFSLIL